jgi:hypothetical protein
MTPKTLKIYNSKWPEEKIYFILDLFLTKCIRNILLSIFIYKNGVLGDFSIKAEELPPVCDGVFVYSGQLRGIYGSQRPIGV